MLSKRKASELDNLTTRIEYLTEKNRNTHESNLYKWLKSEFDKCPKKSGFWNNIDLISNDFQKLNALVVINSDDAIVGFMTWKLHTNYASIEFAQVRSNYQRQGIFKRMLAALSKKYPSLYALTAYSIPEANPIYEALGWKTSSIADTNKTFHTIIKPGLTAIADLPDGPVIAICTSANGYYSIIGSKEKYAHQMRYFKISLDTQNQLKKPLMVELEQISGHNYEIYIELYLNKKSIMTGKPSHLFETDSYSIVGNLLVIHQLYLDNPFIADKGKTNEISDFLKAASSQSGTVSLANSSQIYSPELFGQTLAKRQTTSINDTTPTP